MIVIYESSLKLGYIFQNGWFRVEIPIKDMDENSGNHHMNSIFLSATMGHWLSQWNMWAIRGWEHGNHFLASKYQSWKQGLSISLVPLKGTMVRHTLFLCFCFCHVWFWWVVSIMFWSSFNPTRLTRIFLSAGTIRTCQLCLDWTTPIYRMYESIENHQVLRYNVYKRL